MVQQTLLPPTEGHLSAQPFINTCYSELCMSQGESSLAPHTHQKKLGWVVAAIFIVADMVGGGVVAMPVAFKHSGLICGIFFMIVIAVIFEYTGYQLGIVWCKMMDRYPHLGVCRKPFPEMAKRTIGTEMQRFTSVMGNVTLFGISIVYLLLSSKILHYFVDKFVSVSICHVIVTLAVVILPFTFLKSPGEFAHVIVLAMVTTVVAVLSIHAGIAIDYSECIKTVNYPVQDSATMSLSLGIFLFSFSGHFVFPSIQHDMKEPRNFTKSIIFGFGGVVLLYMPLAIFGYLVYGDSMDTSVITSIQTSWIQVTANLMIAIHCIMTLVIVINPLNQEVEHYLKVSHGFGVGRVVTRTTVLFIVLFVALTVPDFSPVMNVVGASTIPVGCVLLPSLFYLYSEAADEDQWRKGNTPTWRDVIQKTDKTVLIVNIFILCVALGGGVLGTYQGIDKVMKADFSTPCYLRIFTNEQNGPAFSISQRCCGKNWDVSSLGTPEICSPRNLTLLF